MFPRRTAALLVGLVAAAIAAVPPEPVAGAAGVQNDPDAVEHALSRLTYGARPGDVERVQRISLATWIDQQLDPSGLDDSALARRLPQAAPRMGEARRAARAAIEDLAAAKLARAAFSERQLEEILVDFWFNHFNVFAGKGRTAMYLPDYERAAIRPYVLGRFRDLLGATARHPAMLFCLDNWLSVDPDATRRRPRDVGQQGGRRRGLNENYARELLELHSLGVDGGYTQQDVTEVARAFTGWTIDRRQNRGGPIGAAGDFRFAPVLHDRRAKVVLGHAIDARGGIEDGERVLDLLAAHPATAHHIATKLARRFVSDEPQDTLVARTAQRFRNTGGDLREVVRTIITSPEFFAAEARHAKVKTPLEFVVSVVRATAVDAPDTRLMLRALRQLGMTPYLCAPPTGYDDTAETWITPGALVTRINAARQLAGRKAAVVLAPEFQRR